MRDDGPGHGGGVYPSDHPEHAEPAEVLSPLLLGQELRVVGKHDGNGPSNPGSAQSENKDLRWNKIGFYPKEHVSLMRNMTQFPNLISQREREREKVQVEVGFDPWGGFDWIVQMCQTTLAC